jgi:hypothetical protein
MKYNDTVENALANSLKELGLAADGEEATAAR